MQHPTLTNVRIRSTEDAHKIFYAVQRGRLEKIKRRLDAEERSALCSGCVYIWEERGSQTVDVTGLGIERFTEGKRWTPSRVRDDFLFYYQIKPSDAPRDWDQLIKQTYSVWVNKNGGRRKWHLNAYFTEKTVNDLQTIDNVFALSDLIPPPDLYHSARARPQAKEGSRAANRPARRSVIDRTYAPFSNQSSLEPVTMHNPYNVPSADTRYSPYSSAYASQAVASFSAQSSSQHTQQGRSTPPYIQPQHSRSTPPPYIQHAPHSRSLPPYIQPSQQIRSTTPYNNLQEATNGARMSMSPSMGPADAYHGNPAWSSSPSPYALPVPIINHLSTPRSFTLPPVNTMYNEQQLQSPGLSPILPHLYSSPVSHDNGLPVEYELASHDGNESDGSRGSQPGRALAPIHDLERKRYTYRRHSLDDRALRSFL